jgi:mannosyltransferase
MLTTVDAVHGTYYALLHVWIDLFGRSMLSIRLPSALAVGAASAGIVVLCRRLGSGHVGIAAALVFAVLPRTGYMGGEARSYALSAAVAVWVTVFAVSLLRRPERRRRVWLAWGLAVAATIAVFLYAVLALVGLGIVAVLRSRSQDPAHPTDLARAARWSLLGLLIASPVIAFAVGQRDQISFLGRQDAVTPATVLIAQWFGPPSGSSVVLAVVGWAGILVGLAVAARRWRPRRAPVDGDSRVLPPDAALLPAAAAAVVLVPLLVLLAADLAGAHVYTVRYLSFATPFVAILLAVAVDAAIGRIGRRAALVGGVVAVLVIAALAGPSDIAQRQPLAKDGGSDWAEVAAVVGARARPGDAVAFDETAPIARRPRAVKYLYPADFAGLADVTLETPSADTQGLRDVTRSLAASRAALESTDGRLWFVDYRGASTVRPPQLAQLARLGYRVTASYRLHRDTVYRLDRR